MTRPARGFTLFEFGVCMALCAVLVGGLLARVQAYQAASERAAMLQLLASVRTAMAVRVTLAYGTRGEAGLVALMRENPLGWLEKMPENYQGIYYRPDPALLKAGHWYFDPTDQSINFLQRNDTFTLRNSKLLKFKVELSRMLDRSRPGGPREGNPGLILDQVTERIASKY
jgi:hypothetical protein